MLEDDAHCQRLIALLPSRSGLKAIFLAVLGFMKLSNGPLWVPAVYHGCPGCASCRPPGARSKDRVGRELGEHVCNLFMRHLPTVPVASKWTKTFPCLLFAVVGILIHCALPRLFDVAFKGFKSVVETTSAQSVFQREKSNDKSKYDVRKVAPRYPQTLSS